MVVGKQGHAVPPMKFSMPSITRSNSLAGTNMICPLVSTPNCSPCATSLDLVVFVNLNTCVSVANCQLTPCQQRAREKRRVGKRKPKLNPLDPLVFGVVHPSLFLIRVVHVLRLFLLLARRSRCCRKRLERGVRILLKRSRRRVEHARQEQVVREMIRLFLLE